MQFHPESYCDKNLAIQKVFVFSDSDPPPHDPILGNLVHFFSAVKIENMGRDGDVQTT